MKLQRTKRRAAAKVLFMAFGVLNTIANTTLALWPTEQWDETFTEKEKLYLASIRKNIHEEGERLRKLAWRLQR